MIEKNSQSKTGSLFEKIIHNKEFLFLCGILFVGLVLRAAYLSEIVKDPDFTTPTTDAAYHDYWARALVSGDWTQLGKMNDPQIQSTPYFRPPGYPYFLAFVYWLTGSSFLAARIVQMGIGLINCILPNDIPHHTEEVSWSVPPWGVTGHQLSPDIGAILTHQFAQSYWDAFNSTMAIHISIQIPATWSQTWEFRGFANNHHLSGATRPTITVITDWTADSSPLLKLVLADFGTEDYIDLQPLVDNKF